MSTHSRWHTAALALTGLVPLAAGGAKNARGTTYLYTYYDRNGNVVINNLPPGYMQGQGLTLKHVGVGHVRLAMSKQEMARVLRSPELLAWLYNESPGKDDVVVNDRWGKDTRHKHGGYWTTEYTAGMSVWSKNAWLAAFTACSEKASALCTRPALLPRPIKNLSAASFQIRTSPQHSVMSCPTSLIFQARFFLHYFLPPPFQGAAYMHPTSTALDTRLRNLAPRIHTVI